MSLCAAWRDRLPELERCKPWPRYYHFRAGEMAVVQALSPLPRGETMLELGCGNAFHSALLAGRFRTVIATDLHAHDTSTHTLGLDRARDLIATLALENIRLVAASAEALPLATASVDFVFSSNVLEHVPDRPRAVREIRRVLRPGGSCLTIVPAAMERVYNLPLSYLMIIRSMVRGAWLHLYERRAPVNGKGGLGLEARPPGVPVADDDRGFWARARGFLHKHYPDLPFPKPHGDYRSSTEEFLAHRPARWRALFRSSGFEITRCFTTILAPHTLGMAISPAAAYWIARAGWPLTRRVGGWPGLRCLGTSYAMVGKVPERASP